MSNILYFYVAAIFSFILLCCEVQTAINHENHHDAKNCISVMNNLLCFSSPVEAKKNHTFRDDHAKAAYNFYRSAIKNIVRENTSVAVNSNISNHACLLSSRRNLQIPLFNSKNNRTRSEQNMIPVIVFKVPKCSSRKGYTVSLGNLIGYYFDLLAFSATYGAALMVEESTSNHAEKCQHKLNNSSRHVRL